MRLNGTARLPEFPQGLKNQELAAWIARHMPASGASSRPEYTPEEFIQALERELRDDT